MVRAKPMGKKLFRAPGSSYFSCITLYNFKLKQHIIRYMGSDLKVLAGNVVDDGFYVIK